MSRRTTRTTNRTLRSALARSASAALASAALLAIAAPSVAQQAWVKDELRLNLRTGPGVQYRIMGVVSTGDAVQILDRGDGWTKIRAPELGEGWIPEGYLQPDPPAAQRLAQSEAQTAEFRDQFQSLTARVSELESTNQELASRDESQRAKIDTLTRENLELRAGARWPEWITGAGILSAGMIMGVLIRAVSARRSRPRIRI